MKTYSVTDVGRKRESNQDFVYCTAEPVGRLMNLFIVADGMGGHNAGDYASRFAAQEFVHCVQNSAKKTIISTIEDAICQTNHELLKKAQENEELSGMGTTFVVATVDKNTLYVANIGDSRLYLIRQDKIRQITQDHSLVEEMIRRGEVRREEARFHPNKNVITRALGANVDIVPDFFEVKLLPEDVILICSDGVSNMVDDAEILSIIREYRGDVEKAGQQLLMKANEYGGRDNISILLVADFSEPLLTTPDGAEMR